MTVGTLQRGAEQSTAGEDAPATRRRRLRGPILWVALLIGTVVVLGLLTLAQPPPETAFDPDAASETGSRALARVLADQGVEVDVVRRIGALEDAEPGADTTVVVSAPNILGDNGLGRLLDATRPAARLVLVLPRQQALDGLGFPLTARLRGATGDSPDCGQLLRDGEALTPSTASYESEDPAGWTGCFPVGNAFGLLVGTGDGPQTWVLGFGGILQNDTIDEEANAAAAIRLLGGSERLVWYHPGDADVADAATAEPRGLQLPEWFSPIVTLLAFAVGLLALIHGRRLGRIVTEPLPVVVRAAETTEGRGRLYRRAHDRGRSVDILRAGTSRRLARRLGLGRAAVDPDALVDATSRATGLETDHVRQILLGPVEDTDAALIRCAQQLTDLEDKVAHS